MNGMKKNNMVPDLSSLGCPFLFLAFATSWHDVPQKKNVEKRPHYILFIYLVLFFFGKE